MVYQMILFIVILFVQEIELEIRGSAGRWDGHEVVEALRKGFRTSVRRGI